MEVNRKIQLHYGSGHSTVMVPESRLLHYCTPRIPDGTFDGVNYFISIAENKEIGLFPDITGKKVCILIEDSTRNTPHHSIIKQIFGLFKRAGEVLVLIATGSHDSHSPANEMLQGEIESAALNTGMKTVRVHIHDCEKDAYILCGITKKGTPVLVNELVEDRELFFAFSDMKNHYFAGYSNPIKLFFPGIVHSSAIERNHSLALCADSTFGRHPLHPDPQRQKNTSAQDMYEAYKIMVRDRPVYAYTVVSYEKKILWGEFGMLEAVVPKCIEQVDTLTQFRVTPADCIIVSPGGYPDDESLYISQRALELTKAGVKEGGEVLFLSECRNGIGAERTREHFYNQLTAPLPEVLKSISSAYTLYSHKSYKFAQMLTHLKTLRMYTQLASDVLEKIHLTKAPEPQEVINRWIQENPYVTISIFDGANKLAVYSDKQTKDV